MKTILVMLLSGHLNSATIIEFKDLESCRKALIEMSGGFNSNDYRTSVKCYVEDKPSLMLSSLGPN